MKIEVGMKLKDKQHGYILTITKVGPYFVTLTHTNGVFYFSKISLLDDNFTKEGI